MKHLLILVSFILVLKACAQDPENKLLWTVAWSHDDKYIAAGGEHGNLKIFDAQSCKLIKSYPIESVTLSRVKWHPHENKLAVITQSDTFKAKILDLENEEWIELDGLENSLRGLDWNHNGELLAVSEFEGEVSVYSKEGKRVSRFLADPKSVTGIDWHPTENILTVIGSRIGLFSQLGDTLNIFQPRDEEVLLLCVEWHPSGKFFATGDYGEFENAENKLIQFWDASGEKIVETQGSRVEYRNIRWSPDGRYLASANDALRIWSQKGRLLYESDSSKDYLWGIDWNSDGTKIITTSSEGLVGIWDEEANFIRYLNY